MHLYCQRLSSSQLTAGLQARCQRPSSLIATGGRPHVDSRLAIAQCSSAQSHSQTAAGVHTQISKSSLDTSSSAPLATNEPCIQRRGALALAALGVMQGISLVQQQAAKAEDVAAPDAPGTAGLEFTEITHQVYLDIAIAPRSFKTAGERTLGDKTVIPLDDAAPVGRIVLGLYGNAAPGTVSNFLRLVNSGSLTNTVFSKVLPGEYIQAGQQGAFRLGQVEADKAGLEANSDLSSASAFKGRHLRPGTLSLSLSENDEDPVIKSRPGYRATEFLITTGPGPVPRLDGENVVFGRVLQGMPVVSTIAQVPTFKPSDNNRQWNFFAQQLGDDRAAQVRRKYGKPLKAVIITGAGELPLQ